MTNLLTDPLIRVGRTDGQAAVLSLPGVYEAMVSDEVASFPALRPHQRHAWHAFLAQLAVLAMVPAGRTTPPGRAEEWRDLLRALTVHFPGDEPWRLVVKDASKPAFMQCPALDGLGSYKRSKTTPDDLDILVTSKNHDVKSAIAEEATAGDWVYALVDLQTMGGFMGAGNYGVARMNGGFSSRPCLGLAPRDGGLGAHLVHDIGQMIAQRDSVLDRYPDYFDSNTGAALLWLLPWDGTEPLEMRRTLDPYFIEICRRVRLAKRGDALIALTANSKKRRIAAAAAKGNVGDHWTPVDRKDGKALSVSRVGFRYDRLADLILDQGSFRHPPALRLGASERKSWRLVARGVAAGQGKTEGYHERTDIAFRPSVARSIFGGGGGRETLADLASAQIAEIKEVASALRFGIAIAASGGKDASSLTKSDREKAYPYLRRLDSLADAHFFESLQDRYGARQAALADGQARSPERRRFARRLVRHATRLLEEAIETVPCPAIRRHRARARAMSAYWWRLRRSESVFSDQSEIFESTTEETKT